MKCMLVQRNFPDLQQGFGKREAEICLGSEPKRCWLRFCGQELPPWHSLKHAIKQEYLLQGPREWEEPPWLVAPRGSWWWLWVTEAQSRSLPVRPQADVDDGLPRKVHRANDGEHLPLSIAGSRGGLVHPSTHIEPLRPPHGQARGVISTLPQVMRSSSMG